MRSNGSARRLVAGLGLLVGIAILAALASTSAFAFTPASDTRDTTNGVVAVNGTLSVTTLPVASTAIVVASFTANNVASAAAGVAAGPGTNIRTMYQQWRHTQQNDWFYLYAQNGATSVATPVWDYYYYTPARGSTRLNTASAPTGTIIASTSLVASNVYLTTGTGVPAFWVENLVASVGTQPQGSTTVSGNTFRSDLGWGISMQGFRNDAGTSTIAIQEAAETFPYPAGGVGASRVFYDGWTNVNSGQATIALGSSAPTQATGGLTNGSGARTVNTATQYTSVQTVNDADGDLADASVIWVFTSGTQTGQWFQAGMYVNRAGGGYRIGTTATAFYQSWNEAVSYTTSGAQLTTNYFTTLNISSAPTVTDRGGGAQALNTLAITYSYVYANLARGGVTLYGRAEDWHGRSSGNVQVGTQTIT